MAKVSRRATSEHVDQQTSARYAAGLGASPCAPERGAERADVDPHQAVFALSMVQAPARPEDVRELFRRRVYAAIDD